ncbi:hypothetical protein BJX61DRAFT_553188 [Aspergillus egyptiacus]|nr:hypothetical protein BJX61DRAFT_553188 [Aspergillus egyptiacus]
MDGETGKPANNRAPARKKDAIHFVNARPSSETERANIKRLVRAHVGKWISTQTKDLKDRATGSAVVVAPPLVTTPADKVDQPQAFDIDSDDPYLPSTSASSAFSPTSSASSRASPDSCVSSSSHTAPPACSAPPASQPEFTLAILPSRPIDTPPIYPDTYQQSDNQDSPDDGSSSSDTPSPPQHGGFIEVVGAGRLDPFRAYPAKYEAEIVQVLEEYCLSCLWPGLTPGPSGTNMQSWFPMSLSDPTLFTAFMFGALSHMRVQALNGWIPRHLFRARQQRLLQQVEMETIQMVSKEIDNPDRAVCDAIIFSVVCMAHNKADENLTGYKSSPFTAPMQRLQWLDVYGSLPPNLVHIGGLVQMIQLRGGIDKIRLPGLASIISFSDLVTSTTFLAHPVFPFVPLEDSRRNCTMQELLRYTDASIDHYHSYLHHLGLPRILGELLSAMNTYTGLVEQCIEGTLTYDPSLLSDQRNIIHYTLAALPHAPVQDPQSPPNNFYPPQPQDIVYETARLACFIYSVGVILPLPAQSTPITKLADHLYNTLRVSTHLTIWTAPQAQVTLLWILTLGGIAATHTPHRAWYVDMLVRVVEHNNIASYEDLKHYLSLLAWYPAACEKPGVALWADIQRVRERRF